MAGFRMPWAKRDESASKLKDRLSLVLAYDRASLPPGRVQELQDDLMAVLKRYFPEANGQVDIEQGNGRIRLQVEVPINSAPVRS